MAEDAATPPARNRANTAIRRRMPPEVRRRMLLQAARGVIAERGLHATTLRDIAAAGDVAVGTVTYHFSGITEVLAGVLDAEMQEYSAPIMAAAAAAATGREALQLLIDGLLADGQRARDHWKLWLDFWALSAHDDRYADWQRRVYDDLHTLVAEAFRRGGADNSLTVVEDPRTTALESVALLDGLVVQCYRPQGAITLARGRAILTERIR